MFEEELVLPAYILNYICMLPNYILVEVLFYYVVSRIKEVGGGGLRVYHEYGAQFAHYCLKSHFKYIIYSPCDNQC